MGETLTDAVKHAQQGDNGSTPLDEYEYVDWKAILRHIVLNVPGINDEAQSAPYRPVTMGNPGAQQIAADGVVHIPFPARARQVNIYNGTTAVITRSYGGPASAGSWPVAPGVPQSEDVLADGIWIWSTNAATINDVNAGGIVIEVGY